MSRRNVFDILAEGEDLTDQLEKIDMFLGCRSISYTINAYTVEEVVDVYCLPEWKFRGSCTSCEDIRRKLGIERPKIIFRDGNMDAILLYLDVGRRIIRDADGKSNFQC